MSSATMPEVYSLGQTPITCHAFNADRSQLAVSLNSHEAQIMNRQGNEWVSSVTLSEHDKLITSIDWAPNSNRIVTCSQDRNAYVWQEQADGMTGKVVWKPTLVLLRINRAATHVRWSPNENKFAVASGARAIAICSFDAENNWWVAKQLKKPIRSTVLDVEWHPNNVLLAAGSADMKARVFSAYIKEVDEKPPACVWGTKLPFNTLCGEYASAAGGWVHAVGFSPSGDILAFASHDSTISVVYPGGGVVHRIKMEGLPVTRIVWTSEDTVVGGGHDCRPRVFTGSGNGWEERGTLDDGSGVKSGESRMAGGVGRLKTGAFATFRDADSRGQRGTSESKMNTIHQNTITCVRAYSEADGTVSRVSTSGVDGTLVIWDVKGRYKN